MQVYSCHIDTFGFSIKLYLSSLHILTVNIDINDSQFYSL